MKLKLFLCLITLNLFGNDILDLEPDTPIKVKTCNYTKQQKHYGYRTYEIFEDKNSEKVVIFSKSSEKLYSTKTEMKTYDLYNCNKLLPIIYEIGID